MPESIKHAIEYLPLALGVMKTDGSISLKALGLIFTGVVMLAGANWLLVSLAIDKALAEKLSDIPVKVNTMWIAHNKGDRFTAQDGRTLKTMMDNHNQEAEKWKLKIQRLEDWMEHHGDRHP